MYWGIHNAFVYKVLADVEYNIKVRYRTPFRIYLFNQLQNQILDLTIGKVNH